MKHVFFTALFILYPLLVYFGLQWLQPGYLAGLMACLVFLRQILVKSKIAQAHMRLIGSAAIVLLLIATVTNSSLGLKFYPVVINIGFLAVFAYSLYKPPSFITQIASLTHVLSESEVRYTVKVTQVWCLFFVFNALVSLATVLSGNDKIWLVYNGFIAYILIGLLFAGEFLYRKLVKKYGN